jgi:hypothetical protein
VECEWETSYQTITDAEELQQLSIQLQRVDAIAIDTETTSTSARSCKLAGISIAWGPGQAAYIPIRTPVGDPSLNESLVVETLRPVIESGNIPVEAGLLFARLSHPLGMVDDGKLILQRLSQQPLPPVHQKSIDDALAWLDAV